MACHFSPYGIGLTNLPPALPKGSMVILNDRIPMAGHDPDTVVSQLRELEMDFLLLDFQRPPEPGILDIAQRIAISLSCPVGVPSAYGKELDAPLFLPLPAPDQCILDHLSPWKGREIWLELSLDAMTYEITEQGSFLRPLPVLPECGLQDPELCCHYRVSLDHDRALFDLWRTRQDLDLLLEKAEAHGVTKAVGLWQEFEKF